jgi:hypothetical protein
MFFSFNSQTVFITLLAASLALFAAGCVYRFRLIVLGRPANRFTGFASRLLDTAIYAFGQKRVLSSPFGLNHFAIFWSFVVLVAANGAFVLEGVLPSFDLVALLPVAVRHAYLFCVDLLSLTALVCVLFSLLRRTLLRPP